MQTVCTSPNQVLFKVKKHGEHIVKHDCRIALSYVALLRIRPLQSLLDAFRPATHAHAYFRWKIELKAPLKDFSVEEPEIPNRNSKTAYLLCAHHHHYHHQQHQQLIRRYPRATHAEVPDAQGGATVAN